MANLPNRPFMFNYNAREYNPSTYTFPKTQGQVFDEDIVLNEAPQSYADDYVYFGSSGAFMGKIYPYLESVDDPFNRDYDHSSFTFIYKTSGFTSGGQNLFANRNSNYNYMVRGNMFHTSNSGFLSLTPSQHPEICVIRIQSDGTSERSFVDAQGNVLQTTSASSINWGNLNDGIAFFAGYAGGDEYFEDCFYWMYCSLEALTDAEILQVIKYNESTTTFELDDEEGEVTYLGGTLTTNLTADLSWTASTEDTWHSFTPETGDSGTTQITITIPSTNFNSREGHITFTDEEGNEATYTIRQSGTGGSLPIRKMYRGDLSVVPGGLYRGDQQIPMMFRDGNMIYRGVRLVSPGPTPPEHKYITITNYENTDGTVTIQYRTDSSHNLGNPVDFENILEVSNDGVNWGEVTGSSANTITITLPANGCVYIDGTKKGKWSEYRIYTEFDGMEINGWFTITADKNHTVSGDIMNLTSASTVHPAIFPLLFCNDVKLRSAEDLILSSTTLARSCYNGMFSGCTYLEYPPVLPAATLADYSYAYMFYACARLKKITCLATDISANRCTSNWTRGVTSRGTFYCDPNMTSVWQTGYDGVPTNWTITPYSE